MPCTDVTATKTQGSPDQGGQEDKAEKTVPQGDVLHDVQTTLEQKQADKQTLLDIFRHRQLLFNAAISWIAW